MIAARRPALIKAVLFPSARAVLVGLLLVDAGLLVGHVLHEVTPVGPFSSAHWSLTYEGGFATLFGGAKLGAAAAMMWVIARRTSAPIDLAWAFALVVVVMDDLLRLHEGLGGLLVDWFRLPGPFGVDPLVLAELVVWALIGVVVTTLLVIAHRSSSSEARKRSFRLGGLIVLLIVFAIGLDVVNAFFLEGWEHVTLELIEDGGELVTMSLVVAYVARVTLSATPAAGDH